MKTEMTKVEFDSIDREVWLDDEDGEIGHEIEWRRAFYSIAQDEGFAPEQIQAAIQKWGGR